MFGTPRGPEGPHGPDTGRSKFENIDVLPLGKTLGIKSERGERTGLRKPRTLNIRKMIMKGFPSPEAKEIG